MLPDHVLDFINRHAVSHVDPKSPESPQDKLLAPLHCSPHVAITLPTDSWPSGRRRTPGKCVGGEPSRGFESLTVRHTSLKLLVNFRVFSPHPPSCPPSYLRLDAMGCDRSAHSARKIGQPKGIGSNDTLDPRGKVRQGMTTVAIPSRQRRAGRARSNAGRDTFAVPVPVAIPAIPAICAHCDTRDIATLGAALPATPATSATRPAGNDKGPALGRALVP